MPKVLLTQAVKDADREAKMNKILAGAVGRYCAVSQKKQYEVAEECGVTGGMFSHWMKDFGNVKLNKIRRLAHKVNMTPEEWLRLGGYDVKEILRKY